MDRKPFDFSLFSDRQILDLGYQVRLEIERRRAASRALAEEHGYLTEATAPRYRNPDNPVETWAGRGPMPGWVKRALAEGKELEILEPEPAKR